MASGIELNENRNQNRNLPNSTGMGRFTIGQERTFTQYTHHGRYSTQSNEPSLPDHLSPTRPTHNRYFFPRKPSVVPEANAKKTERLSSPAPSSYTPPLAVHAVGRTIPRKPRRFPQITSCSTSRAERERRESRRAPSASHEDPSLRTRPPRRSCPPHL